jgi:multiple sugar transport system substrate-binding protein
MVKQFNRENPDVNVLMQRMDWSTYYNKLFVAGLGGRAPELFILQTHAAPRFANAGFVRAVDDLAAQPGSLDVNDIDANVWQAISTGGKHYGVPLDIWPTGMYYNCRLLRDAGILDSHGQPAPPTNRAQFLDAARKLTLPARNDSSDQWGFVFTNFESNVYSLMLQFGGDFFTPDYSRCIMNGPKNVEALQFCVDLIRKYKVAPPPENYDAWIGFRQGKIGMVFEGIYMLADLQKQQDLEYGGAPVPIMGEHAEYAAGSHNICIRSDLHGSELDAAWRFARFLSVNSLDWAAGGQIPVRKSLRDTPRFKSMRVQSAFAQEIPNAHYLPRVNFIFEFMTEFDSAAEKALRGSATPQAALDTAAANLNKIIARDRDRETPPYGSGQAGGTGDGETTRKTNRIIARNSGAANKDGL